MLIVFSGGQQFYAPCSSSAIDQTWSVIPAFIAGVVLRLECEGEEGKLFLPLTKSSNGRTEGRELARSNATLVFDKTTSTFYLQKVKQKKKARRNALGKEGKERKRADAKLPLFSLPALEKGGAVELLKLWNTAMDKTKHLREWKIISIASTTTDWFLSTPFRTPDYSLSSNRSFWSG